MNCTTIYVGYFNTSHIFKSDVLQPIQLGRAKAKFELDMLGDNTGPNISKKNDQYCELTAHYWAWKNDKTSDNIGLFHYRRLLDLKANSKRQLNVHGLVYEPAVTPNFLERYDLTQKRVDALMEEYDAVIPTPFDFGMTLEKQYRTAPDHHINDLLAAGDIIDSFYPEYFKYFTKMMRGTSIYAGNMFIFRRDLFEEYSEWLFDVLAKLERRMDVSDYTPSARRAIGYISERLFTVFILKMLDDKQRKVYFAERVFIQDTKPVFDIQKPKSSLPITSIAIASDEHYVAHLAALLASILDNASGSHFLDLIILDGGLGDENRRILNKIANTEKSCIRYISMKNNIEDIPTNTYFRQATFFRLKLPELLKDYDSIVFLDTDLIVMSDIAPLFDFDLGNNLAAAVPDLVVRAFISMGVRSLQETGALSTVKYLSDYLGMKSRYRDYFQSGVIYFNLKEMRKENVTRKMIRDLINRPFWFLDQDVLNKYFQGRVKFLPSSMNTVVMDEHHWSNLCNEDLKSYQNAQKNPQIVHFAGHPKPWDGLEHPFSKYYWYYLRKTPYYETVLMNALSHTIAVKHPPAMPVAPIAPAPVAPPPPAPITVAPIAPNPTPVQAIVSNAKRSLRFSILQKCWHLTPSKGKEKIKLFATFMRDQLISK